MELLIDIGISIGAGIAFGIYTVSVSAGIAVTLALLALNHKQYR